MGKLFLLCGKPGSGKTTLSNFIKTEYKAIAFSADNFMLKLFGEIQDRNTFDLKLNACKELIYEICDGLLKNNNVVLDFGFWTKDERTKVVNRFSSFDVILIYLKLGSEAIFRRIEKRNANLKNNKYFMDRKTFDFLSCKFEEPDKSEKHIVFDSNENLKNALKEYHL